MTRMPPRCRFVLSLLSAIVFCSLLSFPSFASPDTTESAGFRGARFSGAVASNIDYTHVTTLGEFDRAVFRKRWSGLDAPDVLAEFARFKGASNSPAVRDLWRELLLGDFDGLDISRGAQQGAFMAERLRVLNRLGFFDEAVRLYVTAARDNNAPIPDIVARQGVDAMALAGSADGACLEVLMAAEHLKSNAWLRDAALCSRYMKQTDRARDFYKAAIKNGDKKSNTGFRAAYKALKKGTTEPVKANLPPVWRCLLLANGAPVTADTLKGANASTLASLAQSKKVPLPLRLMAASRGADLGTVGSDRLRKLYELKNKTEAGVADITARLNAGQKLPQSDIYAAARFTFRGDPRAKIVTRGIAALPYRMSVKSHVYGWVVDKLTLQAPRIAWFAPRGYGLMVLTNRAASANIYYEAGNLAASPLTLVHAVVEQTPVPYAKQKEWKAAAEQAGLSQNRITKAYAVARAFDVENKLTMRRGRNIIETPETKPIILLQDSVKNGGKGLTLISALNLLAKHGDLSKISTAEVSEIITTMGEEGLFGERKKIALEVLLQTVL
jgi:hypothetical protein